jgi:phage protein D
MAVAISGYDIYAPVFTVSLTKIGKDIPRESISGIEIDENLEAPAKFTISLNEVFNIDTQRFRWLDDDSISPGTEVALTFGYASKPEKQSLIKGKIKGINSSFVTTGPSTLTLEGYDNLHDMQKKNETKLSYEDMTYSDVVKEIATLNNLVPKNIDDTKIKQTIIQRKHNEKDYDFVKRLANTLGFEFFVRGNELYFREAQDKKNSKITFRLHNNLLSFSPRMTSANLVNEVQLHAYNANKKEPIIGKANINDLKSSVGIRDLDHIMEKSNSKDIIIRLEGKIVKDETEAKAIAMAELKRRNQTLIEGTLECIGDPLLRPGMTVNIEKVGERFSGVYYVKGAKHSISESGYKTILEVRRCL